ncbi:MAG: helix-turn-helix transcriptional regulator [Armatimonadetes bacterium]|nr:helix-turn-helix transcriptional regulator [Armatimonadota bacterium]
MKQFFMYLDEEPTFGPLTGFGLTKPEIEWIQAPGWYLLAVVAHDGILTVGGETVPFKAGSALIAEPSSRCRIEKTSNEDNLTHFWLNFLPQKSGDHRVALPRVADLGNRHDFWDALIRQGMDLMPFTKKRLHSVGWDLLWSISRNAAEVRKSAYVEAAERFVNQNIALHLTVAQVADSIQISHNHLIRLFRDELGVTPSEFIRSQRLREACQLLMSTSLPIKEVGQKVGYPDPKHFHRVMTATLGSGPAEIRRNRKVALIHTEALVR